MVIIEDIETRGVDGINKEMVKYLIGLKKKN